MKNCVLIETDIFIVVGPHTGTCIYK